MVSIVTPTFSQLKNAIKDYVVAATGLPETAIIESYNNYPRAKLLFILINVLNTIAFGNDSSSYIKENNEINYYQRGNRILQCSIQAFRTGAYDAITAIQGFEQTPRGVEHLSDSILSYKDINNKIILNDLQGSLWEERWGITAYFYYTERRTNTNVGEITRVPTHLNLESGGNIITKTETIER